MIKGENVAHWPQIPWLLPALMAASLVNPQYIWQKWVPRAEAVSASQNNKKEASSLPRSENQEDVLQISQFRPKIRLWTLQDTKGLGRNFKTNLLVSKHIFLLSHAWSQLIVSCLFLMLLMIFNLLFWNMLILYLLFVWLETLGVLSLDMCCLWCSCPLALHPPRLCNSRLWTYFQLAYICGNSMPPAWRRHYSK